MKLSRPNKLTECLDKMTEVDTYDERYKILYKFSKAAYAAGAEMAIDKFSKELKKEVGAP